MLPSVTVLGQWQRVILLVFIGQINPVPAFILIVIHLSPYNNQSAAFILIVIHLSPYNNQCAALILIVIHLSPYNQTAA